MDSSPKEHIYQLPTNPRCH
nr:unnamed protein product [Callosobruchus analis]